MSIHNLVFMVFLLGLTHSDGNNKRVLLHSDQDLDQAFRELRQEIDATKQENAALKAQLAQVNQTLKAQITQESLSLKAQLSQENQALKSELAQLRNSQGSTYIRWGRTVCGGNGTQKVYSGYAGGSFYNTSGGAASYICLPETPSWARYMDGKQGNGGYVFGAEYQTHERASDLNPFSKEMDQEDVPCVVCRTPRTTTLMIPASTACNPGWTMEYTGYLMTGHNSHPAATDYACVDKDPEAVLHGEDNKNGKLFYVVEAACGSLPCQAYPDGRELACTVCSK